MMSSLNQPGSRRWTHFQSALKLAIQRSAHKWTYEDFAECFPLYAEEEKNGSSATFNTISDYIEAQCIRDLDTLFKEYDAQKNLDILHKVLIDAKERKARGELGNNNNVWKEDLEPRTVVCARTIPILEGQQKRLQQLLEETTTENRRIQAELENSHAVTVEKNKEAAALLRLVDDVCDAWQKLPANEIEAWTVQTSQALKSSLQ
ncbi:hypothetical protein BD779DRAFT_747533 [Infundibulicybe gibba]|nr:hypothetical protein BD779DRAFT_747533 [Infundibulicybe gibba]